ncbi:MAG: aminomethyl-transferring glycine dehydrogenase subunit GcvPA [Brevefilum sp.]|nr:aminomethyl-transferring glycine dehydrogenase subunit GcvPA [Brevefilum sp.]MDW7753629.1 aminomethyl-transferring glycine dehydrogenase subunit GcvPA [Brevefilum sp.]
MYTPHTPQEIEEMLRVIGVNTIEDLFLKVPERHRFPELDLPEPLTEMEASAELQEIASANASTDDFVSFLGAGAYNHYIPAAVDMLLRRGEFYTAYTPYQPEVSQGTLQATFEYQSLMAELTGMDISNASHYDGATAAAEAANLAYHFFRGKSKKVLVSRAVNPQYRETIRTYMQGLDDVLVEGDDAETGFDPDMQSFIDKIDNNTAIVIVQYPDFFGRIIDYTNLVEFSHQKGALVAFVFNPTALGLLKPPGEFDVDIAVGDGQPLGIPLSYGGPYLGIFTTKQKYVRKLAGRLVGETEDEEGQRAYVLTLTAREQHIRREKSTSNICTNQGLMALAATVYLSLLGKSGFKQVANLCYQKAHYAAEQIADLPGYELAFPETPFFHEFVIKTPKPADEIIHHLQEHWILAGYDLSQTYSEMKNHILVAVNEKISKFEIDEFVEALKEVNHD